MKDESRYNEIDLPGLYNSTTTQLYYISINLPILYLNNSIFLLNKFKQKIKISKNIFKYCTILKQNIDCIKSRNHQIKTCDTIIQF